MQPTLHTVLREHLSRHSIQVLSIWKVKLHTLQDFDLKFLDEKRSSVQSKTKNDESTS